MKRSHNSADVNDRRLKNFRRLSYELLRYSTKGMLRIDFLPKISRRIMEHSGSDALELWVKEGQDKHFRCVVRRDKEIPFGFALIPSPLIEEVIPELSPKNDVCLDQLCRAVIQGVAKKRLKGLTERGSFWSDIHSMEADENNPEDNPVESLGCIQCPYKSIAIIPIRVDEECIGLMQLMSNRKGFLSEKDLRFYEDISEVLGVALSHQYAQIELRERIKELTCMYGIAQIMARPEAEFSDIMQNIVDLLPPAWLFPDMTCAQIFINGETYQSKGFRETPYRQKSDIIIGRETVGFIEVLYLENKLTMDEGPFLNEERKLIDNIAREISIFCERAKAEKDKSLLQDQLRHADRLATIGQLAAGVAHELNEPLGNILGFAQLAKKSADLPEQVERDLANIESASLNAREIIKKLMAFARQLPPKKALVDLNDIIAESKFFFEGRCKRSAIELKSQLSPGLPKITIDAGQINQVLVNLIVNAIQAMPDGGTLTIMTRSDAVGVYMIVEDTGIGIEEEQMSSIFLPFYTTKDVNEGTGLGLAVVHGIVTAHGGSISVESKKHEGSRFTVFLPGRGKRGLLNDKYEEQR